MGRFLTGIIEQLDLALEHLSKGDANNARFALMLVDNVVEIVLHKYAGDNDKRRRIWGRIEEQAEEPLLTAALGRGFDQKVRYAKSTGLIADDATAQSINICHGFRNEVYHVGIQHEPILPALAGFYFGIGCGLFERYSPNGISWGSNSKIPDRAQKYFGKMPGLGEHQRACRTLKTAASGIVPDLGPALATHMLSMIQASDRAIEFLATDGPKKQSRSDVIVDCQAWTSFTTESMKTFAAKNGCPERSVHGYVEWLKAHYPWPLRKDPITSWLRQSEKVQKEPDPNKALHHYCSFIDQTWGIRDQIDQLALVLDQHIEEQIDRARGK